MMKQWAKDYLTLSDESQIEVGFLRKLSILQSRENMDPVSLRALNWQHLQIDLV
jgi:ActR/RegA family two-component response regulator